MISPAYILWNDGKSYPEVSIKKDFSEIYTEEEWTHLLKKKNKKLWCNFDSISANVKLLNLHWSHRIHTLSLPSTPSQISVIVSTTITFM